MIHRMNKYLLNHHLLKYEFVSFFSLLMFIDYLQALIETLGNENGESNNAAIECCLWIGNRGKELDYKYEQLVS